MSCTESEILKLNSIIMRKILYIFVLFYFNSISAQIDTVPSGTGNWLLSVYFVNPNIGYTTGYYGTVLKSTDGGNTWFKLNSGTANRLSSVYFANENYGIIVAIDTILKTTDGGQNWIAKETNWALNSVYLIDTKIGYAAGNSKIIKTSNGGETWSELPFNKPSYQFNSICFTDSLIGYVVAHTNLNDGEVYKTIDGGENWILSKYIAFEPLNSICFPTDSIGYAVGNNGTIIKTVDAGNTWTDQLSNTKKNLWSIDFINKDIGYAVGNYGIVIKTENGGISWDSVYSDSTGALCSISFSNVSIGYSVGWGGKIIKINTGQFYNEIDKIRNSDICVYPNPTETEVFFSNISDNAIITVYDIQGKLILNRTISGGYLDISFLKSGLYQFVIRDKNNMILRRIIKE